MKQYPFLFAALLLGFQLAAQSKPTPIYIAPDAPAWVQLLHADAPNVHAVQAAYEAYYAAHPFEKNSYTQYYKRWMQWARYYVQPDGSLHVPPAQTQQQEQAERQALRQAGTRPAGWTFVGPKRTFDLDGATEVTWQTNIYSFAIAPSDPNILYAGGETGGVWRTDDKGLHWTLLTPAVLHDGIGAVAIHPTDPNTVFFGTSGKIVKSADGGQTWSTAYSENNLWTNDLCIVPDSPNVILAATDQGMLRSNDGGATWTKRFSQQCWTVKAKPGNGSALFAVRKNGSGSDFLRSTDGGLNFSPSNTGWWTPGAGETVTGALLAVCPSKPDKLYAYLCGSGANLKGYIGVFVSADNGDTWANTQPQNAVGNSPLPYSIPNHANLMTNNGLFSGFEQGFYDMAIVANPNNDLQLIAGGTSWFRSNDGGATWQGFGGYVGGLPWRHPDIQWLAAQGNDLWIASDGGLNYSTDFGATIETRMNGISGADLWGFDAGWNEDVLVGGRYHNGNMAWHENFPAGSFYRMGGAESPTGYVNPGENRKTYFSDIGGWRLNGNFSAGASGFSVGLFPNESYAYYANSEMAWDPRCWNIGYLGFENKIWKTLDGGASWEPLHTFPGASDRRVYDIEVAHANPDVLYCSQWDGTDDALWRSNDGGQSWNPLTPLPLPNNNDRVKMAVSAEDPNVLWVAVTYGSNGKKIYKSVDGGQSWINLTTPLLNGVRIANIMAQYGTDGGVYLGTNRGVYYRNNSHADWQPFAQGLPVSAETNRLKPFYKNGKIRNGCWGFGVWEADLFEPSATVVQPMASALQTGCARDTVYFDDYSAVHHDGATWAWSFSPAPQYVSAAGIRNPKVVFGAPGAYTATLVLNGQYEKSLDITVDNLCEPDTVPGLALALDGAGDYAAATANLNLDANTVTLTAWIKREGPQTDFAGILFARGGNTTAGLSIDAGQKLRYHWNDAGWWWDSGLTVPNGVWTHVALVISPNNAKIYLNGNAATHNAAQEPEEFDAPLQVGYDNGNRYFKGLVEEAAVWSKALSQAEIRELMHLTKAPADFPELAAYYQFNENGRQAYDKSAVRHLSLVGGAARVPSAAPVGKGVSARVNVLTGGEKIFGATGLALSFPASGPYPNGEVCVSRINQTPDFLPASLEHSQAYWVVNNYGTNPLFNNLVSARFDDYGAIAPGAEAPDFLLYRRGSFDEGDTWGDPIDQADSVWSGVHGAVLFAQDNNIDQGGQFILHFDASVNAPAPAAAPAAWQVYPNPAAAGLRLHLRAARVHTGLFELYDLAGHKLLEHELQGSGSLELPTLPAGMYLYSIRSAEGVTTGKLGLR